jgi:TPR repeat protein
MSKLTALHLMTALIIIAAASLFSVSTVYATDMLKLVEQTEASWPDWLPKPDRCPADLMPAHENSPLDFSLERCSAAPEQCLAACRTGTAGDCYATAIVFQKARPENDLIAQALFQRACMLGMVSGCTNRAAAKDMEQNNACAIRTYDLACDRDDPWACTMVGLHLIRGIGIEKNLARARQALAKSCRFGDGDEACRASKALLKEIGG